MLCSKGRDYEHAKLRSMSQITVMTGPEGHRRWREEERQEIVAAAFAPGESVAEIGRRFDVWRPASVTDWRELGSATPENP